MTQKCRHLVLIVIDTHLATEATSITICFASAKCHYYYYLGHISYALMDIFQAQCTMIARKGFIAALSPAMLQQDDFLLKLQQFRNKPYILSPTPGGQAIFVCSVRRGL